MSRCQRLFERRAHALRSFGFGVSQRINVIVVVTLPGHGAVKAEQAFVACVTCLGGRQHGGAYVCQKPFEANVGDLGAFQQAAQQLVSRQRVEPRYAEQLGGGKARGPRPIGARDALD